METPHPKQDQSIRMVRLHDILPTWENLVGRHVIEVGTCGLCTRTMESALHALWECGVC